MAKRGGSGKSSFQDLCVLPDPSKDSWTVFERRLLEGKSHLLALRPADAEAVTNFMIVMQLHTFIKQGICFHRRYRGIVGSLGYLVNMTRPDLAWSYSELSKYVQNPGKAHMDAAHHVLRYLRATYDQPIVYERTNEMANTIWGWVDSDWAADLDSRRSHTGYILMLAGGAVSWKSRRQDCVSLSTSEAEYVAASQCGQEVVYRREILRDFGFPPTGPTRVYEDNLTCVAMSENPVRRKYSRHIDIRCYFVRDLVAQQILKLVPLRTNLMVADALTKSLPSPAHAKHRDVMIGRVPFCVRTLRSSHCVRGG
jgi:hypothetical protein